METMLSPNAPDVTIKQDDEAREELAKRLDSLREQVEKQKEEIARCGEIERSLRESEEKYRFLVENSKDIIWKIDTHGRWTFVSGNVKQILGYSPDEVIGKTVYDFVAPEYHGIIRDNITKRLEDGELTPYSVDIIAKDGRRFPFEVLASTIRDKNGRIIGIQGISRDIAYRKQAEERLKKYYDELERRVEERTAELDQAKEQVELYLDLMGHDINNMNHAAMGYLEIALDALAQSGRLEADKKQLLEKPLNIMENSSALIDKVRKIQHIQEGRLRHEAIDLERVLNEVKRECSHVAGRSIRINFERKGHYIVIASPLLKDVFSNLVGNAIKHSTGPLTVDIKLDEAMVNHKKYYRVDVEDNGPGIPDARKAELLSRKKIEGKGLGLYLVRTLIRQFNGIFCIEDRVPGDYTKGTRAVVMLPAADN